MINTVTSTKIFVPDENLVWVSAEIVSEGKDYVEVRLTDKDLPLDKSTKKIYPAQYGLTTLPLQNTDIPENGVNDMCSLSYLHEPSILDNLRRLLIVL